MKVLNVIGTRPEAIKMGILHKLLLEHEKFHPILCLTGQHTNMAADVLNMFNVVPDYCCFLKKSSKSLTESMAEMLNSLQELVEVEKPDFIMVQGDTLSSYCGAMVGFLNQITVGHVEAGLRTNNKWSPYPEEIFRKFNDALADVHFAVNENAIQNLNNEGIFDSVFLTGNTGIDALLFMQDQIQKSKVKISLDLQNLVRGIKDQNQKLIILTLHRREGYKKLIPEVLKELNDCIGELECQIIFPVHTNPNVQKAISKIDMKDKINCIGNLVYHEFIWLMMQCDLLLTDSGGIQEEAPYLGKPVIVIREVTERQEVVELDANQLYRQSHLKGDIRNILAIETEAIHEPYGNGRASHKIVKILEEKFLDLNS